MTVVSAHEVVATVLCKTGGCEGIATDRRGRYAGLCPTCKTDKIAADREQLQAAATTRWKPRSALATAAADLQRQAKRLDRLTRDAEAARAELRTAYLEFGVAAGFLGRKES